MGVKLNKSIAYFPNFRKSRKRIERRRSSAKRRNVKRRGGGGGGGGILEGDFHKAKQKVPDKQIVIFFWGQC